MRLRLLNSHMILESVMRLYCLLAERKEGPYWPVAWSDKIISNPKFIDFLQNLGISGKIGKPMHGGVGRAYPVGDQYIVKFTTDAKEAGAAATIKGHNSDHAADIYAVHRVGMFDHPSDNRKINLYAIVMQRLNTGVSKKFRSAGNAVYSYLDDHSGFIENPETMIDTVISRYLNEKQKNDPAVISSISKVVYALYDIQQKTGVLSQDPHGGNIAFKSRKPAFFDFGRSSTNYDHPKTQGVKITPLMQ